MPPAAGRSGDATGASTTARGAEAREARDPAAERAIFAGTRFFAVSPKADAADLLAPPAEVFALL